MALQSSDTAANGFTSAVRDAWLSAKYMSLFTQRSPFIKMLRLRGNIQPAGYGVEMREPLMVPVLTGPQLEGISSGYAANNPTPMTGYTSAKYALSQYAINVSWEDYEDVQATGEVEMVKWRAAHFENAIERSNNRILDDLWKAPEDANSAGIREQLASIRTFVNAGTTTATDGGASPAAQASQSKTPVCSASSSTAITLVGKIERSAAGAAYWCPGKLGTDGTSVALTVLELNDLYEEAFQAGEEPDLILMPSGLFSKITNLMTVGGGNGGQMYGESRLGKLGFSAIRFRNADIVVDRRVPASGFFAGGTTAANNHMYCLNMKHFKWRARSKKPVFKDVPSNKLIQEQLGAWYCCLTADHLGNVHSFRADLTT